MCVKDSLLSYLDDKVVSLSLPAKTFGAVFDEETITW